MKKFIVKVALGALLAVVMLFVLSFVRVLPHLCEIDRSLAIQPWQTVLCVGDSHVGCTFVESKEFGTKILWNNSTPKMFSLFRLLELERLGRLKNVNTVIVEFGYQTISGMTLGNVEYGWKRTYPICWRYIDKLPVANWKLLWLAASGERALSAGMGQGADGASILERPREWLEQEGRRTLGWHFGWLTKKDKLYNGWDDDLWEVLLEIKVVCERNNIRLVIFTSPLSTYYRNGVPCEGADVLRGWQERIKGLGVEYYDEMEAFGDEYFRDSNHLSRDGARAFTRYFLNRVVKQEKF